jgi:hypothetical protein
MASSAAGRATSKKLPSALTLPYGKIKGHPVAFSFKFGDFLAYPYTASAFLDKPSHALHALAKRRWDTRPETFWFSVIAKKHTGENNRRCVRSWLARRLRIAFAGSLHKKGYAPDGTRLDGNQGHRALFGTVQMVAEQPMIQMSQKIVEKQTDQAVLQIIKLQDAEQDQGNKGKESARRPWTKGKNAPRQHLKITRT